METPTNLKKELVNKKQRKVRRAEKIDTENVEGCGQGMTKVTIMIKEYVTNAVHVMLGVLTPFIPFGFVIAVVFYVYELLESKDRNELNDDCIEYLAGLSVGFLVKMVV